jgi:ABC-type phosphate transport system permease subunit
MSHVSFEATLAAAGRVTGETVAITMSIDDESRERDR